jgi:hypothetical protein
MVFALDKNCDMAFITFSEPYITSVLSSILVEEENVKDYYGIKINTSI